MSPCFVASTAIRGATIAEEGAWQKQEARRWVGLDDGCLCCYRQGNSSHKHQDLHKAAFRRTLHSASYFSRSLAVLAGVIRPGVSLCNSTIFCATSS